MVANGANLRCLGANYKVTAVAAFPHNLLALCKYCLHLNVIEKCKVSFLVGLFNSCYHAEFRSDIVEALCVCFVRECLVHICPMSQLFA